MNLKYNHGIEEEEMAVDFTEKAKRYQAIDEIIASGRKLKWNQIIMQGNVYKPCIAYIVLQDPTIACTGNCERCIEHLMNEVVPSQI